VLNQRQTDYRIIPDARRLAAHEIYSVDRVEATSPWGESREFVPFYSLKHGSTESASGQDSAQTFWQASRKPGTREQSGLEDDDGTEVFLSLVDLGFNLASPADWTLNVETTCLNRDLPRHLPFGEGRPRLVPVEGKGLISSVSCLTKPTPTLRPALGQGMRWRLLSHLSLNHLSLSQAGEGAEALREILKLYDVHDDEATRKTIEGILRVQSQRVVGRSAGTPGGVCQGLEVSIQFDEEKFSGSGLYLFASVLDRFIGMYTSVNSFSRLVATSRQRKSPGDVWRWPARAGEKTLL
jgi:type VI secretion system protein ImpG